MKVIYYQLRADIQKIIKDLCKWKGIEIVEGHMMSDYVHQYHQIGKPMRIWFFGTISCKSASKTRNFFSYTTSTEKYY